jgi:NADPH-dependent glutamate synthase beta subunit-like oxidoreductase
MSEQGTKVVVVIGGAVGGSEAAAVCAESGATAIVLEQGVRPYGKIEDGLPRWHDKLRLSEYERIDANLTKPGVHFVPSTKIGEHLSLADVMGGLGPSAVLLASGAWRDRPLGIDGVDRFVGRGFAYQNPFVYWFNHHPEPGYAGDRFEIADGAIVVGGGLASIDVAKIVNFEVYGRALRERGIDVSVVDLEHHGIPETAEKHGIDLASLGVRGATIYYRRRQRDMPLTPGEAKTPAMLEKLESARLKILDKLERKYLVRVAEQSLPIAPIVEDDRLAGLVFRKTEIVDGRVAEVEGSDFEVRASLTVSSIGSIPEPIAGVPTKGELFRYASWDTGELEGLERVWGLGNALTGRGNIKDSRKSARDVATHVMAQPLPTLSPTEVERILATVEERRSAVGYASYEAWIAKHPPLERA